MILWKHGIWMDLAVITFFFVIDTHEYTWFCNDVLCVSETWFTMGDGDEGLDCWRPDICICDQLRVAKYRFFSLFVGRKSLRLSRAQSKLIVTYARTSDSNDIDFVLLRLYSTSSSGFPRPLALFAMSFFLFSLDMFHLVQMRFLLWTSKKLLECRYKSTLPCCEESCIFKNDNG